MSAWMGYPITCGKIIAASMQELRFLTDLDFPANFSLLFRFVLVMRLAYPIQPGFIK